MSRRLLDIIISSLGLLLLAPVILLLALLVFASIGRPILFVQHRSGLAGVPFPMIKFRTMSDARDADGDLLPDAARVSPFGRLLRRTRLDELPGLWNILIGDMALTGPRPLLPVTIDALGEDGHRRGQVRPGLTGWAQVNGNTLLSDEEKLALDLWYIDHASWWLDLRILVMTLGVVVLGEKINRRQLGRAYAGGADRRG